MKSEVLDLPQICSFYTQAVVIFHLVVATSTFESIHHFSSYKLVGAKDFELELLVQDL
jgi:hypothetical protein